jgi:hypothetical protein
MNSIWWNQVTNAVKYVTDIKESLLEEKSILLKYAPGMPWRNQLEEIIIESVKQQNADKKFVSISTAEEPGEYLLHEFCKKEKRAEYRPGKGYARFFAESDDIVLHDRYLWIRVDTMSDLKNWMSFVSEYRRERGKKKRTAVYILEWCGSEQIPVKRGIKMLTFDDYIGEYDRIVFAVLASSGIKESPFVKTYTAEILANTVGNDMELCAECVLHYKEFLEAPFSFIQEIITDQCRSDGTAFTFEKTEEEFNHLIWLSQIKTVYPYLEEYREDFVQRYESAISKQLPIQASYGENYTDPKDVELGTLMHMANTGCLSLNGSDYEKLRIFRGARNKLSHLTALTMKEIWELL